MSHKRMFSKTIIETDAFQDMSQTAQLLYFYFNMQADDDGFVGNPKRIMRAGGFADDDFKILLAKRFLLAFENGVVVIKHWFIHNTIRKDRYIETSYKKEKETLYIKENKAYTDNGNQMATKGLPSIDIGEDRIGKIYIGIMDFWNKYKIPPSSTTGYKNSNAKNRLLPECRKKTTDIEDAFKKIKYTEEEIKEAIKKYIVEILNRNPENDYSNHRFSFYEFLKQKNGLTKFANK